MTDDQATFRKTADDVAELRALLGVPVLSGDAITGITLSRMNDLYAQAKAAAFGEESHIFPCIDNRKEPAMVNHRDSDVAEIELTWVKSSRSDPKRSCVEAAELPSGGHAVRDSQRSDGPILFFTKDEWDAFVDGVRDGEFS